MQNFSGGYVACAGRISACSAAKVVKRRQLSCGPGLATSPPLSLSALPPLLLFSRVHPRNNLHYVPLAPFVYRPCLNPLSQSSYTSPFGDNSKKTVPSGKMCTSGAKKSFNTDNFEQKCFSAQDLLRNTASPKYVPMLGVRLEKKRYPLNLINVLLTHSRSICGSLNTREQHFSP